MNDIHPFMSKRMIRSHHVFLVATVVTMAKHISLFCVEPMDSISFCSMDGDYYPLGNLPHLSPAEWKMKDVFTILNWT